MVAAISFSPREHVFQKKVLPFLGHAKQQLVCSYLMSSRFHHFVMTAAVSVKLALRTHAGQNAGETTNAYMKQLFIKYT